MKVLKYFTLLIAVVLLASCDDFLDVNDDPNNPTSVAPSLILPVAQNYTARMIQDDRRVNCLGNLMMYKDQLEALNTAQSFAEEYVRIREKGFKEEMNNTTDVVDARLALSKVKIERLEAMYGFDKTLAELLKFSGMVEKFENYYLQHHIITENN